MTARHNWPVSLFNLYPILKLAPPEYLRDETSVRTKQQTVYIASFCLGSKIQQVSRIVRIISESSL